MGHYAPMPRGRWVLTSLIPFGWVTWAGFLWAGFRAKKPAWVIAGFVYLAITAGTLFLTSLDNNEDGLEDNFGYILMFSAWAVGIVQAFLTRKPYLRRLAIVDDPALQAAQSVEERRAYARQLALRNPQLARDAGIGRGGGFDEAAWSTSTTRRWRTSPTCPGSTPTPRAGSSRRATASAASPRSRTSA
jgi:hypothetical protein